MMSPWLFNTFMDEFMREMKCKVVNAGAKSRLNGEDWCVATCLFTDATVLLTESEWDLQRMINEFYSVCTRRKLKVDAGKSKVTVFERREEEMIDFHIAFRAAFLSPGVATPSGVAKRFFWGHRNLRISDVVNYQF